MRTGSCNPGRPRIPSSSPPGALPEARRRSCGRNPDHGFECRISCLRTLLHLVGESAANVALACGRNYGTFVQPKAAEEEPGVRWKRTFLQPARSPLGDMAPPMSAPCPFTKLVPGAPP